MNISEVILTVMIAGFSLQLTLIYIVWSSLSKRIDDLAEEVKDIDRRLCRIEGALSAKECCMLKDEQKLKKVE
jgi:hypothetical protein